MRSVTYNIIVDAGGNAIVRREPPPPFNLLHVSEGDTVQFRSNDSQTVIRYVATSPFQEPELAPGEIFEVGTGAPKGPFEVREADGGAGHRHHFECGFINHADGDKFSPWGPPHPGDPVGDDTPVDP